MRSLIRRTLFLVAQLGLLLAVVAWIVGQSHVVAIFAKVYSRDLAIVLHDSGWTLCRHQHNLPPDQWFTFYPSYRDNLGLRESIGVRHAHTVVVPGIRYTIAFWWKGLMIRHWFVISTFALFYAVLKWVYRRRPDEQSQS